MCTQPSHFKLSANHVQASVTAFIVSNPCETGGCIHHLFIMQFFCCMGQSEARIHIQTKIVRPEF